METVVDQIGVSQGIVELKAVGRSGLMLGRKEVVAKTAEELQPGRGSAERQLSDQGIVGAELLEMQLPVCRG